MDTFPNEFIDLQKNNNEVSLFGRSVEDVC